jgi:hypothetical protein
LLAALSPEEDRKFRDSIRRGDMLDVFDTEQQWVTNTDSALWVSFPVLNNVPVAPVQTLAEVLEANSYELHVTFVGWSAKVRLLFCSFFHARADQSFDDGWGWNSGTSGFGAKAPVFNRKFPLQPLV